MRPPKKSNGGIVLPPFQFDVGGTKEQPPPLGYYKMASLPYYGWLVSGIVYENNTRFLLDIKCSTGQSRGQFHSGIGIYCQFQFRNWNWIAIIGSGIELELPSLE